MPGLQAALAEIRNLKIGDKLVYTNIAEKHGVSRTTLSRAHRGVQVPRYVEYHNNRRLNDQQEHDLTYLASERAGQANAPPYHTFAPLQRSISTTQCYNRI
ncbi:hypothetical protein PSPO01_15713 [Paraphaeosphaeria sporulosa]